MGFSKPKIVMPAAAPATEAEPAVVSTTVSEDTKQTYAQRSNRRKGLLSTILSNNRRGSENTQSSTLG